MCICVCGVEQLCGVCDYVNVCVAMPDVASKGGRRGLVLLI